MAGNFIVPDRLSRIYGSSSFIGSLLRLVVAVVVVLRFRRIVLVGGSVLTELRGSWQVYVRLGALLGRKFEAVGVSVGPFANDGHREGVRRFLRRCSRVLVRDEESLEQCRSMGVRAENGGDLAALVVAPRDSPRFGRPVIGVAPCAGSGWSESDCMHLLDHYLDIDVLSAAVGTIPTIRLLALNSHPKFGDQDLCGRLAAHVRRKGFPVELQNYSDLGVEGTLDSISACAQFLSIRLHGAVCAYLLDVPVALGLYHPKCVAFSLDIGLPEAAFADGPVPHAALTWPAGFVGPRLNAQAYSLRAWRVYGD
jgi:polysaccharide pyruvyl transferase WcaK-like protein